MKLLVPMGMTLVIGALFLSSTVSAQGEEVSAFAAGARSITPAELVEMLRAGDLFLVNVSVSYDGEIPQTDAFIRFDETIPRISEYPRDKAARIVLYCLTGRTSAIALGKLLEAGFGNAATLEGGIRGWERAGHTILHRNSAPASPYPAASRDVSAPVPQPCPCGLE